MTVASVVCPGCSGTLKLPPGAVPGRQIRCPACKHVLTVPAGPPGVVPEPRDRAEVETQQLPGATDRAEAETRRGDAPPAGDHWQDAEAQAPLRRAPRPQDEADEDAAQSYGLARRDGEAPPLIGKVGRFELRRFLGQGAFGKVYLGFDPQLDRAVAIKVPRHPPSDDRGVKQFMVEATSAARLKHPNIVAIYEAGRAGDTLYIASEYVEGVPLSLRIAERPPKLRLAVRWVRDLARALQYAHELGVVHRDIKPANVMVGRGDRVQLMDFGLALRREVESAPVATGVVGTPAYMAPEQARGDHAEVGPKSDQYALGAVLYELLTGVTPFRGPMDELLRQVGDPAVRVVPPDRLQPLVPPGLSAVCARCLAKNPGGRYRTAEEFAADLQRWLDGKRVLAGKPPRGPGDPGPLGRAVRWVRKSPRRAGTVFGILLLLAGVVAGGLWIRSRVQEADRKMAAARRADLTRDADVFRERGARLGTQGKPAEGVALLARSYELASELGDGDRLRAVEAAFAEGAWDLPAAPGADPILWRAAGALAFGVPLPDPGPGQKLPHAGPALSTGYAGGGSRVLTLAESQKAPVPKVGASAVLRDAVTGENYATLTNASALVYSPDAKLVCHKGNSLWGVWNSVSDTELGPPYRQDQYSPKLVFNHDGSRLAFYGEDGRDQVTAVWDPYRPEVPLARHRTDWLDDTYGKGKADVVLSPDAKTVVYVVPGGTLIFYPVGKRDVRLGNITKPTHDSRLGGLNAAAFRPDGERLAVAFEKGTELWTPAGERAGPWLPAAGVKQIVFAPDGRHALLVNAEGVRLWDTASGRPIGPPRHPGATRAQFRPDGQQFLTASNGDARVWPCPTVPDPSRGVAARLWAEATTGLEVTPDGQTRPLSEPERGRRRAEFERLAGLPTS